MEQDRWLVEIAAAIADGRTVDWAEADARATDQTDRDLLARLKSVEQVTRGHAAAAAADSPTANATWPRVEAGAAPLTAWGPFRLLERIGRGTFGDVYRAQDPHLDRPIALKLLRRPEPGRVTDSAVIEEARLMARVRHPNVVTVFGADRIDGRVGVWMEFVDGRTLEQELKAHGPFAPADVAAIGTDLCHALTAVHDAGLLHRDMKAQNVMRDVRGRIVLTDFGAGREAPLASDATFELAGTPQYMAPELLRGGLGSPQSEVYGLGVLLYYLSTASFPITGRSLSELQDAHERARDTPVAFPASFPAALAAVIQRAIASDPNVRFQSAIDMAAELKAAATTQLPRLHVRRWRLRWLLVPTMLVGAAGGLLIHRLTPGLYRAQALIQLVRSQVPEGIVSSTNNISFDQRLEAMKQTIFSRTRLERLIEEFKLYEDELKTAIMEEVVQKMRNDIHVNPTKADTFAVEYIGRHPVSVMKVTERLAGFFRDVSQRQAALRAQGNMSFIASQKDDLERKLIPLQQRSVVSRQMQLERDALESRYKKLLADLADARMQVDLEGRQMGEQLVLLEAASLPERPIGLTRAQMVGGGALGGLALGLSLAAMAGGSRARLPAEFVKGAFDRLVDPS